MMENNEGHSVSVPGPDYIPTLNINVNLLTFAPVMFGKLWCKPEWCGIYQGHRMGTYEQGC